MEKDQLFILDKWIKNYLNEKKYLISQIIHL